MPPITVSGKPTNSQINSSRMMVVAGRACVDPMYQATLLTTLQIRKKGSVNVHEVSTMFHAHFCGNEKRREVKSWKTNNQNN